MTNRLRDALSPYLRQHAGNPVDWYPWGDEALHRARAEDRPIFLSIGYSSCHWCHVMAHESFEDERVAAILNEHLVSIKVDREERPDLDRIYMSAVQAMTGQGGWPMSVFLTPEGKPFHAGTYFPPERRHGLPSFTDVLDAVIDAWGARRTQIDESGERVTAAIAASYGLLDEATDREGLSQEALREAEQALTSRYDRVHGGWGAAPKFPHAMAIEFLLRRHTAHGDRQALIVADKALEGMARGGIYDQLGGGFHRYSVDAGWLVPHFEKMLYDNALLARVYTHAWQVTGRELYRDVVTETLDFVLREMTSPEGAFCSSLDADSEGEEGRFYVWDLEEIQGALGGDAGAFIAAYGVTARGNHEGHNVLSLAGSPDDRARLRPALERLLVRRELRVRPGRDDKVLTGWNGLMLAAFADAGRVLDHEVYVQAARRAAQFLLEALRDAQGRLLHVWRDGRSAGSAFLEDYAALIEGLQALYGATFERQWYLAAHRLTEEMIAHYRAPVGFYDTSDDHEELIVRPRDTEDNALPSGNALAASVLLRMADLAVDRSYEELAHASLSAMQDLVGQHPLAYGQWLQAMDYALADRLSLAVIADPHERDAQALLRAWHRGYNAYGVVAVGLPRSSGDDVPLLRGRAQVEGHATAYLCGPSACQAPTTEPAVLRELVEMTRGQRMARR